MVENNFLFHGENTPKIKSTTTTWIQKFQQKYQDNYDLQKIEDSKDFSMKKLIIEAQTVPFLCEKKLIIAKNILHHFEKEDAKTLLKIPESTIILFIEYRKINKTDKQLGTFQKKIQVQQFEVSKDAAMQILNKYTANIQLPNKHIQAITNQYEKSPEQVENIGKQLAAQFHNKEFNEIDFFKLIDLKQEPNIFNFLDTIYKNKSQTLKQYKDLCNYNQDPYKVLYMLIWHLKTLSQIKQNKTQGIKPFIVNKHRATAQKINTSQINTLLSEILKIDQLSKTGHIKNNTELTISIESALFRNT